MGQILSSISSQHLSYSSPVRTRSASSLQLVHESGGDSRTRIRPRPFPLATRDSPSNQVDVLNSTTVASGQVLLGRDALPSFRQIGTVCPGREAHSQFIKSMFLNKARGELVVISVKEQQSLNSRRAGDKVYMQLRGLKLGTLLRATQNGTGAAAELPAAAAAAAAEAQAAILAQSIAGHMSVLQPNDVSPGSFSREQSSASTAEPGTVPPMGTPDGYRATHISTLKTFPLLVNEPEKQISQEGWCEFDDSRQLFLTMSTRSKPSITASAGIMAGTSRVHASGMQRFLRVWTLLNYAPVFTLCCDSGIFKPGGDQFDDIKLAEHVLIVVCKRRTQASFVSVHVYSMESGVHMHRLSLPLEPRLALQSLECMADRIVLKQYKQPLKLFDIRTGSLTASMPTHNGNRASPAFVFLGAHQLLLLFMGKRVRTISLNGQLVANMDVLHCCHGTSCSTTNVFVAEDHRTVYGYCCCPLHAVYALSVVCVISGQRIHEWSSENLALPPAVRHSLRDITSLYVHQRTNLMLTGHADGTVNSWVPTGSPLPGSKVQP